MGAAVGAGGGKGDVNVELNIVPFIDLMSCLTAFLLVTAVWVNIAQLNIQPKGKARDATNIDDNENPVLSVLVQPDKIQIGLSRVNEFQEIPKKSPTEHDWEKFTATLKQHKASSYFQGRHDIEIAAESTPTSPVPYQDLIYAMDYAKQVDFIDVGLTDPNGLAVQFSR